MEKMVFLPPNYEFGKDLETDLAWGKVAAEGILTDPETVEVRLKIDGKEVTGRMKGNIVATENRLMQVADGKVIWQVKLDEK